MVPTEAGDAVVRHAKLALSELSLAEAEVAALTGQTASRVAVGALPFARTRLVPLAVTRLTARYPDIRVSIADGEFSALVEPLRCGDLDFIVGALRPEGLPKDLSQLTLFHDPLAVVARRGHRLVTQRRLTAADLSTVEWVLPPAGAPMRRLFDNFLRRNKLPTPDRVIETPSLVCMRAILMESDRLGVISRHRVFYELQAGQLAALPLELTKTARPIGVISRTRGALPDAAQRLLAEVRRAAREIVAAPMR
jgi:LysR family transcriptional regulator of gallate degradation